MLTQHARPVQGLQPSQGSGYSQNNPSESCLLRPEEMFPLILLIILIVSSSGPNNQRLCSDGITLMQFAAIFSLFYLSKRLKNQPLYPVLFACNNAWGRIRLWLVFVGTGLVVKLAVEPMTCLITLQNNEEVWRQTAAQSSGERQAGYQWAVWSVSTCQDGRGSFSWVQTTGFLGAEKMSTCSSLTRHRWHRATAPLCRNPFLPCLWPEPWCRCPRRQNLSP